MKIIRRTVKALFFIIMILDILVFGALVYLDSNIDSSLKIKKGDTLNMNTGLPVTATCNGMKIPANKTHDDESTFDIDLSLFGIIPFSTVNVEVVDGLKVAVLGNPFGMKIYTDGVLVVDFTDVPTANGMKNPAKEAGIKKGDYILSVNGKEISTNEDLISAVENSGGERMNIVAVRDKKRINISFNAVKSTETDSYKIGIWVRDSSAGIGTLTFYSPATNVICGLGHGVCDEDTGELLRLDSGEIVEAEIISVEKGSKGKPGQLNGKFTQKAIGDIKLNSSEGVYSALKGNISVSHLTEVALKSEVKNGFAQIYCTVDGKEPKLYSCNVYLKSGFYKSKTQNMVVTVTDKELLDKTGGIVQGLSGSPIIQNGKLIGAVTHVLVDDPTTGYAIFAENMLKTAESVEKSSLKEAS